MNQIEKTKSLEELKTMLARYKEIRDNWHEMMDSEYRKLPGKMIEKIVEILESLEKTEQLK